MPGWSDKRERQFEHIEESLREKGKSETKAAEIAARTVNKQRRQAGETESSKTSGTGNPNKAYEDRTKQELINLAARQKIKGRSGMSKAALADALRGH